MNKPGAGLLVLLAASAPAAAQRAPATAPTRLTAQASYEVLPRTEGCAAGYRTTGVRYTIVGSRLFEGPPPHLVLEEKTTVEQCESMEGPTHAEVSVVARPAARPGARPAWTIRRRGSVGEVADEFAGEETYRVTEYGCCGSENVDSYFSLATGRLLFTADHPLLFVDAEPFGTGMVAVHDVQAAGPLPGAADDDRTLIAILAFGRTVGAAQRVALRGPSTNFIISKLELTARGPGGQQKHAQTLGINDELTPRWTVAVVLELEGLSDGLAAGRVEIPIENGRLAVEKARVPTSFRIVAAPR